MEKALDSIWLDALVFKLAKIGIQIKTIKLIKNYLTDRKMYVSIKGFNSGAKVIKVPRGSILGLVLYNIYANDILKTDKTYLAPFADDTAIYATPWNARQGTKYLQEHIQEHIQIQKYVYKWKLNTFPARPFFEDSPFRPRGAYAPHALQLYCFVSGVCLTIKIVQKS